jgi:hypothetical protein
MKTHLIMVNGKPRDRRYVTWCGRMMKEDGVFTYYERKTTCKRCLAALGAYTRRKVG